MQTFLGPLAVHASLYLPLMETPMATTNPNHDSNLNRVDLSLHEFLGAPWKNAPNSKSNPAVLEMLLMPMKDEPAQSDGTAETPLRRRHRRTYVKPVLADTKARALDALEQRQYVDAFQFAYAYAVHACKLTYPYVWYAMRASHAVTDAGLQRVQQFVALCYQIRYGISDLLWLLIVKVTQPAQDLFDILFGDGYYICHTVFRDTVHRYRVWLGRSRGNTYLSAFYQRCRYMVSYFYVHQFRAIDLFVRHHLTIRHGLYTILPIGLICSVVYQAVLTPATVHSRGVNTTSKQLRPRPFASLEQLLRLDDMVGIHSGMDWARLESGCLQTTLAWSDTEFIEGAYAEVEKTHIEHLFHPNEFLRVQTTTEHLGANQTVRACAPMNRVGTYDLSLDEEDQVELPPAAPDDDEKDEETKAAEALALRMEMRAALVPKSRYRMLREADANLISWYRRALQKTYTNEDAKKQRSKARAFIDALPLHDTRATNIPWRLEIKRLFQLQRYVLFTDTWPKALDAMAQPFERRVAISPFGMSLDMAPSLHPYLGLSTKPGTLTPFSKNEIKVVPYAFRDSRELIEALSYGTLSPAEQVSELLALAREENRPQQALEKALDTYTREIAAENAARVEDEEDENDEETAYNGNRVDGTFASDEDETADTDADTDDDDADDDADTDDDADDDADTDDDNAGDEDEAATNGEARLSDSRREEARDDNTWTSSTQPLDDTPSYVPEWLQEDTTDTHVPVWLQHGGTLFLNPVKYEPWQSMVWKGLALQFIMYGVLEWCVRLECRGAYWRLRHPPTVNRLFEHIGRVPEGVHAWQYIGENMDTVEVRKLISALQARRGKELYGQSQWYKAYHLLIRANLSWDQILWLQCTLTTWQNKLTAPWRPHTEEPDKPMVFQRDVTQYMNFPRTYTMDVPVRYDAFTKLTEAMYRYMGTQNSDGTAFPPADLAVRQHRFNRLGGDTGLLRGFDYGKVVHEEIGQFPLVALIKPGEHRLDTLPKGMILLGEPGNGRTYFVRALATAARAPLLVTESNRYLDNVMGLVRLKTLFKRARTHAPSLLFIRDMDLMTRHRERYPSFSSVRATTALLMAIDGLTNVATMPYEQNLFVLGSMTTTMMMDGACMRSGRFEWVLNFFYPKVDDRCQLLQVHSIQPHACVSDAVNVDWNYFAAMTNNFSCLDLTTILTNSAMYVLKQKPFRVHTHDKRLHTAASVAFGLGAVNQVHDLPQTRMRPETLGFFLCADYQQRHRPATQHAPFFTQIGQLPMYKKVMHLFHAMVAGETETLAERWCPTEPETGVEVEHAPDRTIVNGLVPLFCEGLFLYNTQKMCSTPYPLVVFDTYCSPLSSQMKHMLDDVSLEHTLERTTQDNLFITTFDLWRRAHPDTWTPSALFNSKSITMRINATAMWRYARFTKKHSVISGLNELEREMLWGPPPLANKIRHRLTFVGAKKPEFMSCDATLFGTFETENDLAFKSRQPYTGRRIEQVSMEILDGMQKHWRHPASESRWVNLEQTTVHTDNRGAPRTARALTLAECIDSSITNEASEDPFINIAIVYEGTPLVLWPLLLGLRFTPEKFCNCVFAILSKLLDRQ